MNQAITSAHKFEGTDHTIILSVSTNHSDDPSPVVCNGFIKFGVKSLYFYKKDGKIVQCSPVCLLDFYVDETKQRNGIGLELFKAMMEVRNYRNFTFPW